MEANVYCNTGTYWFVRVDEVYHKRELGKGWSRVAKEDIPSELVFSPMPDKMLEAIKDVLPK